MPNSTLFGDPGGEHYFGLSTLANAVTAGWWNDQNGWTIVSTAPAGAPAATNGKVYALSTNGNGFLGKFFASSFGHLIMGDRVYIPTGVFTVGKKILEFKNSGTSQCDVRVADSSGHVSITQNGTVLGTTTSYILTPGWNYFELDVTFATSAIGTADFWANDVRKLHLTSVQTAATVATANQAYVYNSPDNATSYVKDIYVLDPTTGPYSAPLGESTITVLYPTGAGVNSAWSLNPGSNGQFTLTSVANASGGNTVYTGSFTGLATSQLIGMNIVIAGFTSGANNGTFACSASTATTVTLANAGGVAETHAATATLQCPVQDGINHLGTWPDGDNTYIADSTANDISDFAHQSLVLTGTIFSRHHVSYVRKDDVTARTFAQVTLSGATTEVGATQSATGSYLYYTDINDNDPHTSAAWTLSGFNAATDGVKELT